MKKKVTTSYLKRIIKEELQLLKETGVNQIMGDPFELPRDLLKALSKGELRVTGGFEGSSPVKSDWWDEQKRRKPDLVPTMNYSEASIGIDVSGRAGNRRHINLPEDLDGHTHLKGLIGPHLRIRNPGWVDAKESGNILMMSDEVYSQLKAWLDKTMPIYEKAKKMVEDGEAQDLFNAKLKIEKQAENPFQKEWEQSGAGRAAAANALQETKTRRNKNMKITTSYLKRIVKEEMKKASLLVEFSAAKMEKFVAGGGGHLDQVALKGKNAEMCNQIRIYLKHAGGDAAACFVGYLLTHNGATVGDAITKSLECAKKYGVDVDELSGQWYVQLGGVG